MTPVITAYTEDLLSATSSLASPPPPTNGEVERIVVDGGGEIYRSPLLLLAVLPVGLAGTAQAESRGVGRVGGLRKICPFEESVLQMSTSLWPCGYTLAARLPA